MLTEPFKKATEIIETIESYRYEAYFVGGSVRDLLLGHDVNDIDIATSASPEHVSKMFEKVIPLGIEHGTVLVRLGGISYEVTTFREDGDYSDQRHPDQVTFIRHIDGDLKRRDFTINALAMDRHGDIIDLFGGKDDLNNKLIRSVGSAEKRFSEDPLRIIRALRFSSQLGFNIEQDTLNSMEQLKREIDVLAIERVTVEMTKFFQGQYINDGLNYLLHTGIYKHLPILKDNEDLVKKLPKELIPLHSFGEVISLFNHLEPTLSVHEWIKAWKCSNALRRESEQLVHALTYYKEVGLDQWLVYKLDRRFYPGFSRLTELLFPNDSVQVDRLNASYKNLTITSRKEMNFDGNDLINMVSTYSKGPWMSELLEKIEKEIVLSRLENENKAIKEWIRCNPPEIN